MDAVMVTRNILYHEFLLSVTIFFSAKLKSVTDGALNRLDKLAKMYGMEFLPDFVSGDFDSVKPELIETYKHKVC